MARRYLVPPPVVIARLFPRRWSPAALHWLAEEHRRGVTFRELAERTGRCKQAVWVQVRKWERQVIHPLGY